MSTYEPLWSRPRSEPPKPIPSTDLPEDHPRVSKSAPKRGFDPWEQLKNPLWLPFMIVYFLCFEWPKNMVLEFFDILFDRHPKDGSATRLPYYGSNHNGSPW